MLLLARFAGGRANFNKLPPPFACSSLARPLTAPPTAKRAPSSSVNHPLFARPLPLVARALVASGGARAAEPQEGALAGDSRAAL